MEFELGTLQFALNALTHYAILPWCLKYTDTYFKYAYWDELQPQYAYRFYAYEKKGIVYF